MGMARSAVWSRSLFVELIDPRPYIFQPAVYGRLIYTVICMSDRLLNQANSNPHLPSPPELHSKVKQQ